MIYAVLLTVGLLTGCGAEKDMTGRAISDLEITALKSCNDATQSGVGVTLNPIDAEEAHFFTGSDGHISISSGYTGSSGAMVHVCDVSSDGTAVISQINVPI